MSKPIVREPGQHLPIDDMWNVVAEVGNPTREDEYLAISNEQDWPDIWLYTEPAQCWQRSCYRDYLLCSPPYAWMELPLFMNLPQRKEEENGDV